MKLFKQVKKRAALPSLIEKENGDSPVSVVALTRVVVAAAATETRDTMILMLAPRRLYSSWMM